MQTAGAGVDMIQKVIKNMKLTEKLGKIGNKATKQWVAVAAAFILVFPAAGAFGTGNMPVAGSPASGQEKAEDTDITQVGKNTGDSLSEDQQKTTELKRQ